MKLLFYLLSLCIILLTVILVKRYDVDTFLIIRSIQTHYQVLDGSSLKISLYASQISDLLLDTELDRIRIIGEDIAFDVSLEKIEQSEIETYQNRTYFHYEIVVLLPQFFHDIFIENVAIEIRTSTHTHLIAMGNINIIPYVSNYAHGWDSIYGKRDATIMTLDRIIIETQDTFEVVLVNGIAYEMIKYDAYIEIIFKPSKTILINPILIIRSEYGEEMIAGINYISSKRMLEQTKGFHYVYAVY